jgi:hypothetical protein
MGYHTRMFSPLIARRFSDQPIDQQIEGLRVGGVLGGDGDLGVGYGSQRGGHRCQRLGLDCSLRRIGCVSRDQRAQAGDAGSQVVREPAEDRAGAGVSSPGRSMAHRVTEG